MKTVKLLVFLIGLLLIISSFDSFPQNTKKNPASTPIPSDSPSPLPSHSPSSSPPPTNPPASANKDSAFIYPGSTIISQSDSSYELSTTDNPGIVTDWYKEKISSQDFVARSVVSTKTNGNILNKISAKGSTKIEIEIRKDINSSNTRISVRF